MCDVCQAFVVVVLPFCLCSFGQRDAFPVMHDLTRVPVQSDGLRGCGFINVDGRGCFKQVARPAV